MTIVEKAKAAAAALEAIGQWTDLSIHTTSWGCSAYLRTGRSGSASHINTGARISDHDVGEFRRETDGLAQIGENRSVEDIVSALIITDAEVAAADAKNIAKRAAAESFSAAAAAFWAGLPGEEKHRLAPKAVCGKNVQRRAEHAYKAHCKDAAR